MKHLKMILVVLTILTADLAWGAQHSQGLKLGLDVSNSYREFGTQTEEGRVYAGLSLFQMRTDVEVYGIRPSLGIKLVSDDLIGVYAVYSYAAATSRKNNEQGCVGWHEVELLIKGKYFGISAGPKYEGGHTNHRAGVDVKNTGTFKLFVIFPK